MSYWIDHCSFRIVPRHFRVDHRRGVIFVTPAEHAVEVMNSLRVAARRRFDWEFKAWERAG